jgi:hypothetical protein
MSVQLTLYIWVLLREPYCKRDSRPLNCLSHGVELSGRPCGACG